MTQNIAWKGARTLKHCSVFCSSSVPCLLLSHTPGCFFCWVGESWGSYWASQEDRSSDISWHVSIAEKYYNAILMKDLNNQQTFVYLETKWACDFHVRKYSIILFICIGRMQVQFYSLNVTQFIFSETILRVSLDLVVVSHEIYFSFTQFPLIKQMFLNAPVMPLSSQIFSKLQNSFVESNSLGGNESRK
jgi:hypothetical protein